MSTCLGEGRPGVGELSADDNRFWLGSGAIGTQRTVLRGQAVAPLVYSQRTEEVVSKFRRLTKTREGGEGESEKFLKVKFL